jgi:hypothetical protein
MFNPSRDQVRDFFFELWAKYRQAAPLEGLETTALEIVLRHPEYHAILDDRARYGAKEWTPQDGQANPFLHFSLHLAIAEQLAIDQPPGLKAEFARLLAARGDRHEAEHSVLDCLGETVWKAQREGTGPDANAYLDCLRRKA